MLMIEIQIYCCFLLMSIIQTQKSFPKKSPVKLTKYRRFHFRSLTEHAQTMDQKRKDNAVNNIVLPLMEKTSQFPSIFIKQNRNQYVGYKQNIINRSKIAALQAEQKGVNKYQTQRKYEIGVVEVSKLRKRYSLQPNSLIKIKKDYQNIFMSISKTIHNDPQNQQTNSERKYHQEFREIMRLMTINKHSSQQKIILNSQEAPYQQSLTQNLSKSKHAQQIQQAYQQNTPNLKKQLPFFSKKTKPFYAQLKRRVQNKMSIKKQKQPILQKQSGEEQKGDVCGWSTHSFYSKSRDNSLLENLSFQRLKLIQ